MLFCGRDLKFNELELRNLADRIRVVVAFELNCVVVDVKAQGTDESLNLFG